MRNFMITLCVDSASNPRFEIHILSQESFPNRLSFFKQINEGKDYRVYGQIVSIVEITDQDVLDWNGY